MADQPIRDLMAGRPVLLDVPVLPATNVPPGKVGLCITADGKLLLMRDGIGLGVELGAAGVLSLSLVLGELGASLLTAEEAAAKGADEALNRIFGGVAGNA